MDADRTDPAIDSGPCIMYAVQTVEVDCVIRHENHTRTDYCPNCLDRNAGRK